MILHPHSVHLMGSGEEENSKEQYQWSSVLPCSFSVIANTPFAGDD